jgi:hypothetical protein
MNDWSPRVTSGLNVNRVYGNGDGRSELARRFETRLREWAPYVTLPRMMSIVRNTQAARDSSGYGHVVSLHADLDNPELATLWAAPATPVAAPFIPYRLGVREIPPEYMRHRYLTGGEAARFQDPAHRGLESTRYAFRVFKRLYYLVTEHPDRFLPEVTEALEALEALEERLIREQDEVEAIARVLYEAGEPDLARRHLTRYSWTESLRALQIGDALSGSIETRTRLLFGGIRLPDDESP